MAKAYYPSDGSFKEWTPDMVGAAAASHSHNYAGADSAGGAANAVKNYGKATANAFRPIWFSESGNDTHRVHNDNFKYNPEGNVVTCNISGTANYTKSLNGTVRYVTQSSAAKPYWRCLKIESAQNWFDGSVILCVDAGYESGGFGILAVRLRNDNVAESTVATHGTVQWLCRYGYDANQFILKIHSAKATTGYADLYFHATGTYNACNVRILAASTRGANGSAWTLMNDEPRAAMDTREYTAQATGYDVGNVAYASSAGSVAWANVSGRPSSMPASDVYSWAKQPSKPSYTASEVGAAPASHSHPYLPLSGGTMSGRILRGAGGNWISARNNAIVFGTTANSSSYNPVVGQKTTKGAWTVGNLTGDERLVFSYDTDTNFNAGTNSSNTTYLPVGGKSQEIITSATIGSQSVSHATTAGSAGSANSVSWGNVSGKPSTYAPSSHTHDDRYYTESEMNTKLNAKAASDIVTISSTQPTSNTCKLWIKI